MNPKDMLRRFDDFLAERNLSFEAVVIGGAALGLLGIVTRPTRDCDVLHPKIPELIKLAAKEFAMQVRESDDELADDWFNEGPKSVADLLPRGWQQRLQPAYKGSALILLSLGRTDLLVTKLFALCDRAVDLPDCLALAPTADELASIQPWLETQDASPMWPAHVVDTIANLKEALNHGV